MARTLKRHVAGQIKRADDTGRALKLKRSGLSFRDIARILGVSVGTAHGLVKEGLREIPELERAELTKDIVEREHGIIAAHWRTRRDPDSAKVIQASDKILISMFGLEAPTRTEVTATVSAGPTPAEARKVMSELFAGNVGPIGPPDEGSSPPGTPAE